MSDTPEATTTIIDTSMDGTQEEVVREPEETASQDSTITREQHEAAVRQAREEAMRQAKADQQAAIDAAVKKRLARSNKQPSKKDETPDHSDRPEANLSKAQLLELMESREAFTRASMRQAPHLTDRQLATMKRDYEREKPDDAGEWVTDWLDGMGLAKPTTSPAQREASGNGEAAEKTAVRKPNPQAVDNAAPAGTVSWKQTTDPTQLTADMRAQIFQEMGVRKGQKHIREMWERWGKTVRVMPG